MPGNETKPGLLGLKILFELQSVKLIILFIAIKLLLASVSKVHFKSIFTVNPSQKYADE